MSEDKLCTRCGNSFPATPEFFTRNKNHRDGLVYECKICQRKRFLLYKQEHLEQRREKDKLRQRKVRETEHYQEMRKTYRQRPEVQEHEREWRKEYYQANREKSLSKNKQWREKNAEYDRERHKRYVINNREIRSIRHKAWRDAHPGYSAIREHNRRSRKNAIPGNHTYEQIQALLKRQRHKCYYCSTRFERVKDKYIYQIDHTFPVSRVAGADIPANDISYLVLACPTCNQRKSDKFPWEFPEGGRLL